MLLLPSACIIGNYHRAFAYSVGHRGHHGYHGHHGYPGHYGASAPIGQPSGPGGGNFGPGSQPYSHALSKSSLLFEILRFMLQPDHIQQYKRDNCS
jgi:hypothetical protein